MDYVLMADERQDLRTLLPGLERQEMNKLEFYLGKVEQSEEALRAIRAAMAVLGLPSAESAIPTAIPTERQSNPLMDVLASTTMDVLAPTTGAIPYPYDFLKPVNALTAPLASIKEMVIAIFEGNKRFRLYGATSAQIREAIKDVFNRDVARESLSPTLSRMRDEELIEQASGGNWKLTRPRGAIPGPGD